MFAYKTLTRFFPFLNWFPITAAILRSDLIAGITGALVLVPKAMAYAQLSGLPVYFGLYTAFVPAILGALWGSSRQLATGPVAIISLMTAAALTPLAVPFSDEYVGLALLLTLMVGVIQLGLGALQLGAIVNFVSHPVILGFMNAAAIIIALSQLDLLLGIPKGRSESFIKDIWEMLGNLPQTHLPTLAMSLFALALMLGLKKIAILSKPSVLIAVTITTIVSVMTGFAHKETVTAETFASEAIRHRVANYLGLQSTIETLRVDVNTKTAEARRHEKDHDPHGAADLRYRAELNRLQADALERQNRERFAYLASEVFVRAKPANGGQPLLYIESEVPEGVATDGNRWHVKKVEKDKVSIASGGDVVGTIPSGLPSFRMPTLSLDAVVQLLAAALIIALVAFMECVSMAKALAAKTRQRLDPNQELIGQGLANVGGAFFQSYPATGSFTGSVINLQAGAQTGFAMVFNGVFVAVTLLFLTPYLFHLPKATLGVIILLAVTSLFTPAALRHTWKASAADGIVAAMTFVVTLLMAPHLDKGILVGAAVALSLYLYRTMKPRVAQLGRSADGTLHDVKVHPGLLTSEHVVVIRFDGQLYFANVAYFEDSILEAAAEHPKAKYILIVGDGINNLDATGDETISHLDEQLTESGVTLVFSGLKKQVTDVMRNTGLFDKISPARIFPSEDHALAAIHGWLGEEARDDALLPATPPPPA